MCVCAPVCAPVLSVGLDTSGVTTPIPQFVLQSTSIEQKDTADRTAVRKRCKEMYSEIHVRLWEGAEFPGVSINIGRFGHSRFVHQ